MIATTTAMTEEGVEAGKEIIMKGITTIMMVRIGIDQEKMIIIGQEMMEDAFEIERKINSC
jgi:hypothetical protein